MPGVEWARQPVREEAASGLLELLGLCVPRGRRAVPARAGCLRGRGREEVTHSCGVKRARTLPCTPHGASAALGWAHRGERCEATLGADSIRNAWMLTPTGYSLP